MFNDHQHLTYCTFHDRAICSFISNFRDGSLYTIRNGQKIPDIVWFYNRYMNAVDLFDSHLHLYMNTHRNRKWTQCAFNALIKMAITNTWLLYCNLTGTAVTNAEFIELLLREGLAKYHKKPNSPSRPSKATRHMIINMEESQRCVVCNTPSGNRGFTMFKCKSCDQPLHAKCFAEFHEEHF